jgi:hypothetical protein
MTNPIWPSAAVEKLLHVYPSELHHHPVQIAGTPDALRRLSEALLRACESAEVVKVEMMANDGEGYQVEIARATEQQMDEMPAHYSQLGLPWELFGGAA